MASVKHTFPFFSNPNATGASRRHTVGVRPTNLALQSGPQSTEPIPVPTQKAAYQQIQQSLIR